MGTEEDVGAESRGDRGHVKRSAKLVPSRAAVPARPAWCCAEAATAALVREPKSEPVPQLVHPVWPEAATLPGTHAGHASAAGVGDAVPAAHGEHVDAPAAENCAAPHGVQLATPPDERVPAAQVWQLPPAVGLKVPAGQAVHEPGHMSTEHVW